MDSLHRSAVECLLRTGEIQWPGGVTQPTLIDSWTRQRGATQMKPDTKRNKRWELSLNGKDLELTYQTVTSPCWGMSYNKSPDYVAFLNDGICTHDEIRQLLSASLAQRHLREAVKAFLSRSVSHLIVDEAFDLNELDARLVRCAIDSGVGVTLVGDPWQALYEWRGARPDLVHDLLADYPFETMPLPDSFRFKSPQTINLAADLREGKPITLATTTQLADIALAAEWEHLQISGSDIIPLSFGRLDCQTDASIALLLDQVTQARLSQRAMNLEESLRCLRLIDNPPDLTSTMSLLRDPSITVNEIMVHLRNATKIEGKRQPALPAKRKASRQRRLRLLREWLTCDRPYVQGLSVHQAKGREWTHVKVVVGAKGLASLSAGLDNSEEDHRMLYVALTRASEGAWLHSK